MKQIIQLTLPFKEVEAFEKICKRAAKNIDGMSWGVGQTYKRTYRHVVDNHLEKWMHDVVDVWVEIPKINDWTLLATIVDGALFVTDMSKKLVLHNGHGIDYNICDVCKHRQWKKSFVVYNSNTKEELQVGAECAKKFGIGMVNAIYNLTSELYKSYSMYSCEYDGLDPIVWPAHYSDPYAVRSVETSVVVQAAKQYYDEHNGVWKKGGYVGRTYYPSESAAEIRASLELFEANDNDKYYKNLCKWINEKFEADAYNDFDTAIKAIGTDYYTSAGDTAAAFFAIKKFESWKKEQEAKEKGLYIPKRGDYIHVVGKIVNKSTKEGMFGKYVEYEILNIIDGNTYKRSGVVKSNDKCEVDCFAFIKDVWQGNFVLDRTTLKAKKGIKINNEI